MAKSTYYFELQKTDAVVLRNKDLADKIKDIFEKILSPERVLRKSYKTSQKTSLRSICLQVKDVFRVISLAMSRSLNSRTGLFL